MDDGETSRHERLKYDDAIDNGAEPISEEELRSVAEEVRAAFPRSFAVAELVLIDVDPRHLHAFWNLPLSRLEAVRKALPAAEDPQAPMVLRITHADGHEPFDVEVQGLQGQTYVDIWDEERSYRATLGLRLADGSLAVLIEGGEATLPRSGPLPEAATMIKVAAPAYGRAARRGAALASPPAPQGAAAAVAGPPPREDRTPLSEPFASPPTEAGVFEPALLTGAPEPSVGSAVPPTEEGTLVPWPAVAAADGGPLPLDLENALTLSSFVLGRESVQLEVNAELRVFGRTRPGSELKLFGRRVAVRPDGTFSITRPLPNGALVLTALLTGGADEPAKG